jgi:hypothetical protein
MKFNVHMTMAPETKVQLDVFWKSQSPEIRKKVRFRKHLMLDMYMAAFGRGVTVAEPQDLEVAIKIFTRQIVIRKVMFTDEIPDRVGFYLGHLKKMEKMMRAQLNAGTPIPQVAMALRDFMTSSNAWRDNEAHIFNQAWKAVMTGGIFKLVSVKGANGQMYQKYVPAPLEDETWLPQQAA